MVSKCPPPYREPPGILNQARSHPNTSIFDDIIIVFNQSGKIINVLVSLVQYKFRCQTKNRSF